MGKWEMVAFDDLFLDETRFGHKIQKEKYMKAGLYPIIDQGQEYIAGYTDNSDGLYYNVPAIVFGDHTRAIKYLDFPFFLGADGVKLLRSKLDDIDYKFLFYYLRTARIPDTGYNRHFKWLKELQIPLPPLPIQQQIADILDRANALIEKRKAQIAKLDLLVKSKFVEMFGDPVTNPMGWEVKPLEQIADTRLGKMLDAKKQMHFVKQIINYIVKNGMMKDFSVLQESPFSDVGHVSDIFDMTAFMDIRAIIEKINANAVA